jgi:hypothetical protein
LTHLPDVEAVVEIRGGVAVAVGRRVRAAHTTHARTHPHTPTHTHTRTHPHTYTHIHTRTRALGMRFTFSACVGGMNSVPTHLKLSEGAAVKLRTKIMPERS